MSHAGHEDSRRRREHLCQTLGPRHPRSKGRSDSISDRATNCTGPKFFNADFGLAKNFPIIGEGFHAKFRADAFNALNHPNFNVPANNVYNGYDQADFTSSSFGVISSTVEQPGNLNNGARVLQLSLRLEF